ncbi:hypothetical protein NDU88_003328 [Pleurodeles waltl]|uniref:Uncharacterized protein n=1 Tax=Pleurodeles waltl TaxID=8319 RepID=A0AAV7LMR0_PLEWA|nr:hypothetical protein NDU88_003328 [Pleurodeles waltl]
MEGVWVPVEMSLQEGEPLTLKDIMAAIQGDQGSLETKTCTVSMEVTPVKADLRIMSVRVKEAEDSFMTFKAETATLKKQIKELHTTTYVLGTKLADFE